MCLERRTSVNTFDKDLAGQGLTCGVAVNKTLTSVTENLFEDSLCPVTCLCRGIKSWCQMRSAEATVVNDLWVNPSLCPNTLPSLYTGTDLNSISKKFDFCLRVWYLGNWTWNSISINSNCLVSKTY